MVRGAAVWLGLLLTALPMTPGLAGPTWDRGALSYAETTATPPADPGKDRPVWPARLGGPTAHRIGDMSITAAVRVCADGQAELLLPDGGWSRLIAVQLASDRLVARDLGAMSARALQTAVGRACD
jgi:hypothetical protein